ncbi:unnamed protein product, partial [Ambrosiozyma monospora]
MYVSIHQNMSSNSLMVPKEGSKHSTSYLSAAASPMTTSTSLHLPQNPSLPSVVIDGPALGKTSTHQSQRTQQSKHSLHPTNSRRVPKQVVFSSATDDDDLSDSDFEEKKGKKSKKHHSTRLFGKSLRCFSTDSPVRLKCRDLVSQPYFHVYMTVLILCQTGMLTYQHCNYHNGYVYNQRYGWVDWAMVGLYVIYTIEMAMKCIAFGFYDDSQMFKELQVEKRKSLLRRYYEMCKKPFKRHSRYSSFHHDGGDDKDLTDDSMDSSSDGSTSDVDPRRKSLMHTVTVLPPPADISKQTRAFLRSDWNVIDFISIISFWISFALSMTGDDLKHELLLFRALMCLKIFRLFNINKGSRQILKSLKKTFIASKEVSFLLLCFWVLFAIIGVQSFKTSFRRHCVWTNPNDPSDIFVNEDQNCGSYIDPTTLKGADYLLADGTSSGFMKGYRCPVNSVCKLGDNPYNGSVSFDDVYRAMEL